MSTIIINGEDTEQYQTLDVQYYTKMSSIKPISMIQSNVVSVQQMSIGISSNLQQMITTEHWNQQYYSKHGGVTSATQQTSSTIVNGKDTLQCNAGWGKGWFGDLNIIWG